MGARNAMSLNCNATGNVYNTNMLSRALQFKRFSCQSASILNAVGNYDTAVLQGSAVEQLQIDLLFHFMKERDAFP